MARDSDVGDRSWRNLGLTLGGLVAVTGAPSLAWAQERSPDWNWGMHPTSWMWGAWGLGMMVMMLVFWGLVIVGVVLAIKWLAGQGEGSRADRALESSARGTREARSTRTNSKRRGAIFAEDDGDA